MKLSQTGMFLVLLSLASATIAQADCIEDELNKVLQQSAQGTNSEVLEFLRMWKNQNENSGQGSYYSKEFQTEIYYSDGARPDPKTGKIPIVQTRGLAEGEPIPPLIIYLHGSGTPSASGKLYAPRMNEMAKLGISGLSLDLPFHAKGPTDPRFHDAEYFYDWLNRLILKHKVPGQKIYVLGHSFGPEVAFELMLRHPGTIDGVSAFSLSGHDLASELWYPITDKMDFGNMAENVAGGEWADEMTSQHLWDVPSKIHDLEIFISAKEKVESGRGTLTELESELLKTEKQAFEINPETAEVRSISQLRAELKNLKEIYKENKKLYQRAYQMNTHRKNGPVQVRSLFGDKEEYLPNSHLEFKEGKPVPTGTIASWYKPEQSAQIALSQFLAVKPEDLVREPDVGHLVFDKKDTAGNSIFVRELMAIMEPKTRHYTPTELKIEINNRVRVVNEMRNNLPPTEKLYMIYNTDQLFKRWYDNRTRLTITAKQTGPFGHGMSDKKADNVLKAFGDYIKDRWRASCAEVVAYAESHPQFLAENEEAIKSARAAIHQPNPAVPGPLMTKYLIVRENELKKNSE